MSTARVKAWVIGALCVIAAVAPSPVGAQSEVLTNDSVVQMIVGKVPKNLILSKITSTKNTFNVTPEGLVALFQAKVPSDVARAMIKAVGNSQQKALTNDNVIYMVTNKLSRDVIVAKVQASRGAYDLTSTGLVNLTQSKVPQNVLNAMMAAEKAPPSAAAPAPKPEPTPAAAAPAKPTTTAKPTTAKPTTAKPAPTKP